MRVAMVGTRGVPARYGGFETAVEEVGSRLSELGWDVDVYCRNPGQQLGSYRGMNLVNLPAVRVKTAETLTHTALSILHLLCRRRPDIVVLFNAANAPLLAILQILRVPTVVHADGLEWMRGKWSRSGRRYYKWAERFSALHAHCLIADAVAIQTHYRDSYGAQATFIPYGAPARPTSRPELLQPLGISAGNYDLLVARFEPENQVLEAVLGYGLRKRIGPLVVVGSAPYAEKYVQAVAREAADSEGRVICLGSVYDQTLLDQLYLGARAYIHGHTVGGTNPSLLRAMASGAGVLAHDNVFNREVTANRAAYWATPEHLDAALATLESDGSLAELGEAMSLRAKDYDWGSVARQYHEILVGCTKANLK